ncbi:MAG: hypothetical protein AB8G23_07175 [Myxococcota bacterium]
MDGLLNGLSFSVLLTALYILRFRGWTRPWAVLAYFLFFAALEIGASHYLLPKDAFGPALSYVCFGLTFPVLIAAFLVFRYEQKHGGRTELNEVGGEDAVDRSARGDEKR